MANVCFMVHEKEITSELISDFTFDELQDALFDLLDELKKLDLKIKS